MIGTRALSQLHHGAMYLAALLSFLAVISDGPGRLLGALTLVSLPLSWIAHARGWLSNVPQLFWNITLLGAIALTGFQLYATEQSIITTGIRFIVMLLLIKLYSRKGARDDWQIYALSFLLMSAGTATNEDLSYGLVFAMYVLICTFGLAMFHLTSEVDLAKRGFHKNPLSRLYISTLVVLALSVFLSSVGIFFTFPRVGLGFFATKSRESSSMVGFNDKVELGSHGLIRDNPTVALRVEFPDDQGIPSEQAPPDAEGYHWRILGFDKYNGRGWERTVKRQDKYPISQKDRGQFKLYKYYTPKMEKLLDQTPQKPKMQLYLEPLGTPHLPILWPTQQININGNGLNLPFDPSSGRLIQTAQDDIAFERRNQVGVVYGLAPHQAPDRTILEAADGELGPFLKHYYLQLPEQGMGQVAQLARQITASAKTPYQKAALIEAYLQANYAYTTNLPEVKGDNPINFFLFESKQGHCEYYATSMVLLLRSVGVGARLVNGFLGGQWYGTYLAVRQGDAHAWVEVYIPDYGWVPFDPTPAGQGRPEVNAFRDWFNRTYDTMRFGWNKWILEYDLGRQLDALRNISQALSPQRSFLSESGQDSSAEDEEKKSELPVRQLIMIVGFGLLCVGAWSGQRRLKAANKPTWQLVALGAGLSAVGAGWMAWFMGPTPMYLAIGVVGPGAGSLLAHYVKPVRALDSAELSHKHFIRLERAVARAQGPERAPDEGPQAYLKRLIVAYPELATLLEAFMRRYLAARFGQAPLEAQDQAELERLVSQLSKRFK